MHDEIEIRGASTHNLKSVNLCLPRNKLIVITGVSGSGKSSLAFDTLYAEGQRRYVESLSAYARQFLSLMDKPEVDYIGGLSPAIAIEQKSTSHNPRSTVGTITEIYDYLRLLFARAGQPHCPTHNYPLDAQSVSQMIAQILTLPAQTKILLLAPVVRGRKGEHSALFSKLQSQGFVRVRIDGVLYPIEEIPEINARQTHDIEVVVDRLVVHEDIRGRLTDSLETTLQLSDGLVMVVSIDTDTPTNWTFSARYACPACGYSLTELEPRLFSFNHPAGACPTCDGLGVKETFAAERIVPDPTMTLAAGALLGWNRRHPYYFEQLEALAAHYGFALDTAFGALPEAIQKILLYGSQTDKITFKHKNPKGIVQTRTQVFEGVIGHMIRRYHDPSSTEMKEELSRFLIEKPCGACQGDRLCEAARHVSVAQRTLPELTRLSIKDARHFFENLQLEGRRGQIAEKIVKEVVQRFQFLSNIGLDYLTIHRSASTLSGGESQRIRLASQLGAGLVGVMYVLDEPSIGLHQRDNARLLETLKHLRDLGNTVIVVEHDQDAIEAADHVVDMGPGAGIAGGYVTAQGTPLEIQSMEASLTGRYLSGKEHIPLPDKRLAPSDQWLTIHEATGHNLQNISVDIPIGLLTCVTGVSGSGKSTLVNHTLYPHAAHRLNQAALGTAAPCRDITGLSHFDKVIGIDQSPIGRTPRSNPATYTGLLTPIRELFANTAEARIRGYRPGRFSFNVKGGRCNACEGEGVTKVEMHFLSDLYIQCDVCHGQRYNQQTLQIFYKGKSIADVLNMTIADAFTFFEAVPAIAHKLQTLVTVGLSYLTLGQNATTLSGGEAQRVKIAKELSRRDTGKTLYILDEPTTGLHFHDVRQLLKVLHALRDRGNTLVVIEHHLEVIKTADWVIDLGPEGGDGGGHIVAIGTPETVSTVAGSYTGHFLSPLLHRA